MKTKFLQFAVIMFLGIFAHAQVTTSSMTGKVTDESGESLPGATVVAVHTPSGSQYATFTNVDGRFNLEGMRPGGPYQVEISYIGFSKGTYTDIRLFLAETFVLDVALTPSAVDLGEILVVGKKASAFQTVKTGATTNISNEQISLMPTINRSIASIARLSPYANGMGFSGGDGRSTNFTVDGANFNNNFGLSANLPGGGNPISIDAIEEIQIVIAPFDVRQTNFIGGGINAITKSGTNKLRGSAYTLHANQELRGNNIGDVDFGDRPAESRNLYGFTLGGPIIKNKLFFFVSGEYEVEPGQVVTWRPSVDGVANTEVSLSRASASDMEKVKNHLSENYGYDVGSYTDYPSDKSNRKLLARIDWNINTENKLSFRYNYTKNQSWFGTNGNSTDAGFRNRNMNRISQHSMAFSNSIYSSDNIVNSFSLDLNSRLSDNISNQFLATYTRINDVRGSTSDPFPFIDIMAGVREDGSQILEPYISAGYELFTWNNGVNNTIFNVMDNVTYYLSNHKITAGASFEYQMANNSYMRNGTGYYRYASLDDFLNQRAPRDFALTYGYDGESNPAAQVAFNQIGVYAQDEWTVNPNFKVSLGVRADYIGYIDNLIRNNAISDLNFSDQLLDENNNPVFENDTIPVFENGGNKIDVGRWPSAKVQISPRVGFSWDVMGDQSLKLRGGSGLFTGRLPLVFFTNMPTNSGMVQGSYAAVTTYNSNWSVKSVDDALATLAGPIITDVNEMIERLNLKNTISPEDGALPRDINGIDPGFKMPQVWKTSLALDYNFPVDFPLSLTLEGIYMKNINDVMLKNYDLRQPDDTWQRFSGADDRYIYPVRNDLSYNKRNAYMLSNNNDGWGAIGNITLTAQPDEYLHLMVAYTITESKEITGMPGSNAASAYNGLRGVDGPHLPVVQRSQYVVPNKAIASVSYRIPSANDLKATTINLFYSGFSAGGYSFTYSNDMNGDGYATDMIYIPSEKGEIKFINSAHEDAFFQFMDQDKYLTKNKGNYAEAHAARAPWVNSFDLRVTQDFRIKVGGNTNTLQFSLDFQNFGNLLNSEWGVAKNMFAANNGQILRYEGKDESNVPSFSMAKDADGNFLTTSYSTIYHFSQTWRLQLGLRYFF